MQELIDRIKASGLMWPVLLIIAVVGVGLLIGVKRAAADSLPKSGLVPIGELSSAPANWTGLYLSGGFGFGWQSTEVSGDGDLDGSSFDLNKGLLTIGGGYDYKLGNVVAGVMADASFSNLRKAYDGKNIYDVDWQWFVGGRLGLLPAPRLLMYGLAGFTQQEGGRFDFGPGNDRKLGQIRGLTLGGGAEAMLDQQWTVRLEYRWVNGGDGNVNIPDDGSGSLQNLDTDIHQARLIATYRFGAK